MPNADEIVAAEHEFFSSLVSGNVERLEEIVTDDFVIVDVMSGTPAPKEAFVALMGSGELEFQQLEPVTEEALVRFYGETAVSIGRTEMAGTYAGSSFAAKSRYTHVWVRLGDRWRLASAQGTQIVEG
jgi:ketosteroid isomerase-like protein